MGQKPGILIKYPQSNGNWPIPISHLPILGRIMLDLKLWGSSNLYYVHLRTVARLYDCTTYIWVVRRCSSYEFLYGSSMFIDPRQRWLKLRTGECPRSVGDSGGWPCENCSRRLEDFVKGEGPRKWYFIIYNIIYIIIYIYYIICMCVFTKSKTGFKLQKWGFKHRKWGFEQIWRSKMAACRWGNTNETI